MIIITVIIISITIIIIIIIIIIKIRLTTIIAIVILIINVRCVASTHVTSFLSVQVHGESHALTCRPAGFHSEAAGAIDALVAV